MNPTIPRLALTLLAAASSLMTGCLNFKPVADPTRYFVLAALPPGAITNAPAPKPIALGIGPIGFPPYLNTTRFIMRKGDHEVVSNDYLRWGEPPDQGFQRVLAANLALLLGTKEICLSQWRRDAVTSELQVEVARFDVNDQGHAILEASWHVRQPTTGRQLHAATTRLEQAGPPPAINPDGAVATLSDLLGEFSRATAAVLQTLPALFP